MSELKAGPRRRRLHGARGLALRTTWLRVGRWRIQYLAQTAPVFPPDHPGGAPGGSSKERGKTYDINLRGVSRVQGSTEDLRWVRRRTRREDGDILLDGCRHFDESAVAPGWWTEVAHVVAGEQRSVEWQAQQNERRGYRGYRMRSPSAPSAHEGIVVPIHRRCYSYVRSSCPCVNVASSISRVPAPVARHIGDVPVNHPNGNRRPPGATGH
jgi:hypothetical protein